MKARHAANHRRVVGITAVAVDLAEVSKYFFYVVEEVRPLRMPRQLSLDPRCSMRHIPTQRINPRAQIFDFLPDCIALAVQRLEPADLLLASFQFLGSARIHAVTISCGAASLDHRKQ